MVEGTILVAGAQQRAVDLPGLPEAVDGCGKRPWRPTWANGLPRVFHTRPQPPGKRFPTPDPPSRFPQPLGKPVPAALRLDPVSHNSTAPTTTIKKNRSQALTSYRGTSRPTKPTPWRRLPAPCASPAERPSRRDTGRLCRPWWNGVLSEGPSGPESKDLVEDAPPQNPLPKNGPAWG